MQLKIAAKCSGMEIFGSVSFGHGVETANDSQLSGSIV